MTNEPETIFEKLVNILEEARLRIAGHIGDYDGILGRIEATLEEAERIGADGSVVRLEVNPSDLICADIAMERDRQIDEEGHTPERDDELHSSFELSRVAAFYCLHTAENAFPGSSTDRLSERYALSEAAYISWPKSWHPSWKKPKDARRNLIRAAALIVAEIERLDREAEHTIAAGEGRS